jgi:hypothetical protein
MSRLNSIETFDNIKRSNAVGRSDWFYLICLIPLIGAIWLLVLFCTEDSRATMSTVPTPNRKLPDKLISPLRRGEKVAFVAAVNMDKSRIFTTVFSSVYPFYIQKAEKKGHTKEEVDAIICRLTGYSQPALQQQIDGNVDFETFFAQAPQINPNASKITGKICGYRVEEIEDKLMQKIRYLDKLIDELAKGRAIEKILRK